MAAYHDWVPGEIVTASNLDIYTTNLNAICVVQKAPTNNIANNTMVKVQFTSADLLDPLGWHDTGTNNGERFVPNIAGWYEWKGFVQWSDVADDDYTRVQVAYTLNGTTAFTTFSGAPFDVVRPIFPILTAPFLMNGTTDYTEIQLFQTNADADILTADTVRASLKLVYPT